MGNYQRLQGQEAVKELQEIIKHQNVCMMVTSVGTHPPHARPMAVVEVDDNGEFWFLSLRTSEKFDELALDPRATLYFSNPGDQEFLAIHGRISILNDMARKKELWRPIAKAWVPDGVDDPDLRILKLTADEGYYWDTKDGKVVAAMKIAFALVSGGGSSDGGVEGRLTV